MNKIQQIKDNVKSLERKTILWLSKPIQERIITSKILKTTIAENIKWTDCMIEELENEFKFLGMVLTPIPNHMNYASIIGTLGIRRKAHQRELKQWQELKQWLEEKQ